MIISFGRERPVSDTPKDVAICDRHQGIGGDGILEPGIHGGDSSIPPHHFGLRIWNPDGSVAEKSGNGIRIYGYWLRNRHLKRRPIDADHLRVHTGADAAVATVFPKGEAAPLSMNSWEQSPMVRVDMGKPRFSPEAIPSTTKIWGGKERINGCSLRLWSAGMGNPHCVSFYDKDTDLDTLPWRDLGRILERDDRFPIVQTCSLLL